MVKKMGHYEIVEELGRGGMGVVYKGFDPTLERHVAIKVLSNQMSDDTSVVARFKREARSVAALNHPNIIQIYFIGESDGHHYFVMEYVEGESLGAYIRRKHPMEIDEALRILREAALGLSAAHKIGVVHRDIKPANIMIDAAGNVKIADFGIAFTPDLQQKLTATGQFLGTPGYLSPEVCLGEKADARTDIFSLGIVFFEMLTGEVPFNAESPLAMLSKVVNEAVPDVRKFNGQVPPEVHGILTKMVEKSPAHRYQSCEELMTAIETHLTGRKTQGGAHYDALTAPTESISRPPVPPPVPAIPPPAPSAVPMPPTRAVVDAVRPVPPAKAKSRGWLVAILLLMAFAVFAGVGFVIWKKFLQPPVSEEPGVMVAGLETAEVSGTEQSNPGDAWPEGEANQDQTAEESAKGEGEATQPSGTPSDEDSLYAEQNSESHGELLDTSPQDISTQGNQPEASHFSSESQPSKPFKDAVQPDQTSSAALGSSLNKTTGRSNQPLNTAVEQPDSAESQPIRKRETPPAVVKSRKTVVVAVQGDVWIADPVSQNLMNSLQGHSFEVKDAGMVNGASSFLDEKTINIAGLAQTIQSQGGDVLVLAELIYLGERQLQYMGRQSTAYRSRLKLRAFHTTDRTMLGSVWQTEFEYTQLNASAKAEDACRQINQTMVDAVVKAIGN